MSRMIYSKFSNDRDPSRSIITEIMKGDEQLTVRKRAYTAAGQEHIDGLLTKCEKLSDLFVGSLFAANSCTLIEGCAHFEYLEGRTLEEMLDDCLISGDIARFRKLIDSFIEEVKKIYQPSPFQISDDFINVFGEVDLPPNVEASRFINIDLLFSNIIVDGGNWHVIDYEWVFDFFIPINFLIYRTFYYYTSQNTKRSVLLDDNVMKMFGITSQELEQYKQMDYHFITRYVFGGKTNISGFHQLMSKPTISLDSMLKAYKQTVEKMKCQVFYDFGEGFNEEDSEIVMPRWSNENSGELEVMVPEKVKSIRIDPGDYPCMLLILGAQQITSNQNYEVEYTSNSVIKDKRLLVFTTDDPQIIITHLEEETKVIFIRFDYEPYGINTAGVLKKYLETMDENQKMLDSTIKKNQEMLDSTSWKITRPLRWVSKKMRNTNQS